MQEAYDVVVLGSGAAGLTAALAAALEGVSVAVLEKADVVGGTTAWSGAGIWIPGNQLARAVGIEDSEERGLEYLSSLSNGMLVPELVQALVEGGPQYVDFLHEHTKIRLVMVPGYPDYHTEHPGALPNGGRTLEPGLVSLAGLGEWASRIGGEPRRIVLVEMPLGGGTGVLSAEVVAEREQAQQEGQGRALVAGLLRRASRVVSRWSPAPGRCGC